MVSDRIQALSPSAPLAMSQKSQELKAQGVDVINLSVGEPDFATPDHIKAAAKEAIDQNFSFYTPVPGYLSLRKAICEKLQRENGVTCSPEQIVVGNGAKHELTNVIMSIINPGDEVVIPTPAWVSYIQMVILAGGKSVEVPTTMEQNFKVSPEQLEAAITPRTKLVIFCSPSNPTGSVYTEAELRALAGVLARHPQVMVLADEIYEHINYIGGNFSIARCEQLADRVCIINGVSKAYAMTGWRIGFCAAPLALAKACSKLQGQYTSGPCSVSQVAATVAFAGPQECVEEMRQAFARRKDLIVRLAREIPGLEVNEPHGAFYLFPKCSSFFGKSNGEYVINNSTDFALYLLEVGHVATVGGDAFGSPECFRMSYATSDENIVEALRRIKEAVARLK